MMASIKGDTSPASPGSSESRLRIRMEDPVSMVPTGKCSTFSTLPCRMQPMRSVNPYWKKTTHKSEKPIARDSSPPTRWGTLAVSWALQASISVCCNDCEERITEEKPPNPQYYLHIDFISLWNHVDGMLRDTENLGKTTFVNEKIERSLRLHDFCDCSQVTSVDSNDSLATKYRYLHRRRIRRKRLPILGLEYLLFLLLLLQYEFRRRTAGYLKK